MQANGSVMSTNCTIQLQNELRIGSLCVSVKTYCTVSSKKCMADNV